MAGKKTTAVAKRPEVVNAPASEALATQEIETPREMMEVFRGGLDVQIPAQAERVEYVPSYTVPIGAKVQGLYGGSRVEEVQDGETGEVSNFDSFLFRNLNNSGKDIWLRGGWNFGQLIRLAKTREGERITMVRKQDKQHPRDPRLRIAQFDFYRG